MSQSVEFPVEAGHVLLFARAIGDERAEYKGALAGTSTGMPVPPTFVQASAQFTPDYHLRPQPSQKWFGSGAGSGIAPDEGGVLHAEQHYEFHKPVVTGMVLTAETRAGRKWTKNGRRGGELAFAEAITEYRDESGDLVVVARSVGVRTAQIVELDS
jgi:uncharacterized protein YgiB involved in biofilm formation